MDRFSDFSATREIAEISVDYTVIYKRGVGGGTASTVLFDKLVKNSCLGDHRYCSVL
jgi:hypothetical protein